MILFSALWKTHNLIVSDIFHKFMNMRNKIISNQKNENVDISCYIEFIGSLIHKYEWDGKTKKHLVSQLQLIHNKQKDKKLNLSVVGEFSTGKSSFINALLGYDLLVSSVVQGTTVVNTVIEYHTCPVLKILKKDGCCNVIDFQSIEDLKNKLSDITTNHKSARNIELVRVGIPSDLLNKGIRIIDTPGTNSIESWHEDVTKDAIKNLSDLSIILTDAIHPLPRTLFDFIDGNLVDIYAQCAFIVTYYDKIKKSERIHTLDYIRRRLAQELEIEDPKVFPYIAPAVIADKKREMMMPDQAEMVRISFQSQKHLLELMKKNRQVSQIKKLLLLTKETFDILQINMESIRTRYGQEYKSLLKAKQISLDLFIEAEKNRCISEFTYKANDIKDNFNAALDKMILVAKKKIRKSIMSYSGTTADSIKSYISQDILEECKCQANMMVQSVGAMNQALLSDFSAIMESYQKSFENQFKKLGVIKIDFGSIILAKPNVVSVTLSNFNSSLEYMSNEVSKEDWLVGVGGVTGAAIGTAILPGIGTLVGGLIGSFVGAMGTTTHEQLKKNVSDKLSSQLDSVFRSVKADIISTYNINVSAYKIAIRKEIEQYLIRYKSTVDRKIEEHNSLMENNKKQSEKISIDLRLISSRKDQLKSLLDSID